MRVQELIEMLQDCDGDAEVLIAAQPSWPLQFEVQGVATSEDIAGEAECDEHGHYNCSECSQGGLVYLAAGSHPDHPYAPQATWSVAR